MNSIVLECICGSDSCYWICWIRQLLFGNMQSSKGVVSLYGQPASQMSTEYIHTSTSTGHLQDEDLEREESPAL